MIRAFSLTPVLAAALALLACGPGEPPSMEGGADPSAAALASAVSDPEARPDGGHAAKEDRGAPDHAAHGGDGLAATDPSEHSVYLLEDGGWTDQAGRAASLEEHLGGRPRLVALVYTHCSYACPRILAQLKWLESHVGEEAGFALVSIDPERDTPGRLAEFAEATRLDPERWTLLTGSDDDLLALSVMLGVKYRATGDGEFAHSNVITVLDADGVPVHRVEGLDADLEPALSAVRTLAP